MADESGEHMRMMQINVSFYLERCVLQPNPLLSVKETNLVVYMRHATHWRSWSPCDVFGQVELATESGPWLKVKVSTQIRGDFCYLI
jgi:hypothetical protein